MFQRDDVIFINGHYYNYWGEASKKRGTHYVYIDKDIRKLTSAEREYYRRLKYYYTEAMNRHYYEVPEFTLMPRTNRQAASLLSKEE